MTSQQRETLLTVPYRGRTSTPDVYAYDLTKDGVRLNETTCGVEPRLPEVPDASPESIAMLLDAWPWAVSDYRTQVEAMFAGRDAQEAARRTREQAEREKREAEKRAIENARAKEERERLDWIATPRRARARS